MTAPLWTSAMADAALNTRSYQAWEASGVSIDSRSLAAGDLFVALKGPNHDGHDHVAKAIGEGAAAAVVETAWAADRSQNLPLVPVADTMEALLGLARHKRDTVAAKFIGVTGSVGKTGTKESLALALSHMGETHKTMGNLNNHIGLPLTLARLPDSARFAVLEMGMNHSGEIDELSRLGRPHVAIITTVEAVHLEFFNSVEGIADAKAEIFDGMMPGGTAILPRDNDQFDRLRKKAVAAGVDTILGFGWHEDADIRLIDCDLRADHSLARVRMNGREFSYTVGTPGLHWVVNGLAVLGAVAALGGDPEQAAAALAAVKATRGRGASRSVALPTGGSFQLIDESYNASPASVRAAIAVLGATPPQAGGRRIAVLGDMRELGDAGSELHAALAKDLIAAEIDQVFCCGPVIRSLWDALPQAMRGGYAEVSDDLVAPVCAAVAQGDIVTVKGSLGTRMAPIVQALDNLVSDAAKTARPATGS